MMCVVFGFWGAARAYEAMRLTGFGEHKKAVELSDGTFRIFDFEKEI